jgi:hypothetical protein
LASEIALGYTSARKVEENRVNAQLNAGQDVFSIITDPYWKTILNADNSVHIGSRIYKYYDNGGMAIVINNDWALYNNIKNKTFEELRQTHNLIITSEVNGDLGTFFSLKPDGKINEEKPILLPRLSTVAMPNGKRAIYNYSLVETPNGSPTYRWIYSDNTFTTGLSPRLLNENETATLVIDNGSGTNTSVVVSLAPCAKPEFTITIKNGTATFELPGLNTAYFTVMWLIDDKKMSSSNPFTISSPLSGSVTCQLLYKETVDGHIKGDIACDNTQKYTINTPPVNCGIKGSILQTNIISNAGGSSQTWKIDCKLWVQSGEVGCSMKYLRKRLGVFIPASNQGVSTDISGTYIREVFVNGIKNCNIISASGTTALGNGTYPTSISFTIPEIQNIFKDPGKLTSAQKLLVNGVWVGPGTSGTPRLTLP